MKKQLRFEVIEGSYPTRWRIILGESLEIGEIVGSDTLYRNEIDYLNAKEHPTAEAP